MIYIVKNHRTNYIEDKPVYEYILCNTSTYKRSRINLLTSECIDFMTVYSDIMCVSPAWAWGNGLLQYQDIDLHSFLKAAKYDLNYFETNIKNIVEL